MKIIVLFIILISQLAMPSERLKEKPYGHFLLGIALGTPGIINFAFEYRTEKEAAFFVRLLAGTVILRSGIQADIGSYLFGESLRHGPSVFLTVFDIVETRYELIDYAILGAGLAYNLTYKNFFSQVGGCLKLGSSYGYETFPFVSPVIQIGFIW